MSATPQPGPDAAPEPSPEDAAEAARAAAQQEVLAAAAVAFMERGFAATSIDDVARGMGATKGRVYHYYRSKLDLFTDVTRRSLEMIFGQVAEAAALPGTPRRRMERMMRVHVHSIITDQAWHRCAMQGVEMHLRPEATPAQRAAVAELIRLRNEHERLFRQVLEDGIAVGDFRDCDPKITVRTLMPSLNGTVYWHRPRADETEADRARIIDEIVAFALAGLGGATV